VVITKYVILCVSACHFDVLTMAAAGMYVYQQGVELGLAFSYTQNTSHTLCVSGSGSE